MESNGEHAGDETQSVGREPLTLPKLGITLPFDRENDHGRWYESARVGDVTLIVVAGITWSACLASYNAEDDISVWVHGRTFDALEDAVCDAAVRRGLANELLTIMCAGAAS